MFTDWIKDLGEAIMREIAPGQKMKVINKEDFKENLGFLIERTQNFINIVSILSLQDRQTLAGNIFKASNDRNNIACNAYVTIARALGKSDLKIAYDSFLYIANNYLKTLENIDRTTQASFKDKAITVYNTKLSQVAIFGVIGEVEQFLDFTTYLLDNITYEVCQNNGVKELPPPKQYRIGKIQAHLEEFIATCKNRLLNTSTALSAEIDKVRNSMDINLVSEDNSVNTGFIESNRMSPLTRNLLGVGAKKFFIFRWLGEQWNLIKHQRYLKNKKEKEWMESHVALLKLQLQNVDPNSDEYRKQVKIIESYNEMIAEVDQKINSYLEED